MSKSGLNTLKSGEHYKAHEIDSFITTTDAVVLSTNDNELFSDPEREFKVTHEFEGFFEHSSEDEENHFRKRKPIWLKKSNTAKNPV